MTDQDFIFYTPSNQTKLETALQLSLRNVILSIPFAANYHHFKNKSTLISNLILKSIPAVLFKLLTEEQNLKIDKSTTGFWRTSQYDFAYQKTAFKLIHQGLEAESLLSPERYLLLPALIPNRFEGDIWERRVKISAEMDENAFLFTFMMNSKRKCINDFEVSPDIFRFLQKVEQKYGHWQGANQPYSESDFWNALSKNGELPQISLNFLPTLIIAGVAREKEFSFFADTDHKTNHGYRLYQGRWYETEQGGGLSFCNGLIKTKIKNATCPMEALPSLKSIIGGSK